LFRRVERIPMDAKQQPRSEPLVLAHGETGHHHVVESTDAALLATVNPFVCYLRLDGPFVDVVHERSFDTHETLRLIGKAEGTTFFEIRRQREHIPSREPDPSSHDDEEDMAWQMVDD